MDKLSDGKNPEDCAVFVCQRHNHVPVLHIRHARYAYTDLSLLLLLHTDLRESITVIN
jgi:hypothetical protein